LDTPILSRVLSGPPSFSHRRIVLLGDAEELLPLS